ncbi:hypothetical protein Tco_1176194 [Tanacetum coccineum]
MSSASRVLFSRYGVYAWRMVRTSAPHGFIHPLNPYISKNIKNSDAKYIDVDELTGIDNSRLRSGYGVYAWRMVGKCLGLHKVDRLNKKYGAQKKLCGVLMELILNLTKSLISFDLRISAAHNWISSSEPANVALELGKSISLTEAAEEEAARQVHATHARIMNEPVPKPTRRRPLGIAFRDTSIVSKKMSSDSSQKLKGVQTLTLEEQIDADTMKALKESKKTSMRQPCTGGSSKGIGVTPGVPDESTIVPATSSERTGTNPGVPDKEKVTSEDKVILEWGSKQESEYSKEEDDDETIEWVDTDKEEEKKDDDDDKSIDLELTDDEETDDEFMHSKEQVQDDDEDTDDELVHGDEQIDAGKNEEVKDDAKKAELPPTSSSLSVSSGFGDQFLKLSSDTSLIVPHIQSSSVLTIHVSVIFKSSILTSIPETPLVAPATTLLPPPSVSNIPPVILQATTPIPTSPIRTEEKNVSELKKIDHSAEALATPKSYLESKISDDLQKTSTIDLEQEYEKSALEIRKIKKEQDEKQKMLKNPANHALYHALMEALIEDENSMNKGVADTVKNYKRQHDDDEDDDEDPSAGPNQGKKIKRRRTKESEYSMKPSTTKETSKGKAPSKSSKTDKSATTHELIEEPIAEVVMDDLETTANEDVVNDANRHQDNVAPKINKDTWFKQPPRPSTPDPEWNKRQPEQPWFNKMVSAAKDPLTFDELMATPIDFSKYAMNRLQIDNLTQEILVGPVYNLLKGTCTSSIELEYNMEECFKALIDRLDWNDLEGDRCPFDLTKPLPLKGYPGHLTVAAEYFFNNDLEFLKSSDPEKKYTTSIMKTKAARYEIVGIEDMVPTLWSTTKVGYEKDVEKGIKHWGERRKLWYRSQMNKFSKHNVYSTQKILSVVSVSVKILHGYGHLEEIAMRRADRQVYKFKEGDFVDIYLNDIEDMLLLAVQHKLFQLEDSDIVDLIVALRMFTRNETLKTVRNELHHRILDFRLGYNEEMSRRKWTAIGKRRSKLAQIRKELPRDIPVDKIEVLRYDTKGVKVRKGKMQTKTELTLEQTQQSVSDEVLVSIEGVK